MAAISTFGGPIAAGWDDPGLLAAFNRDYGTTLVDVEVVKKVLGTPPVRGWYQQWKEARALALAVPGHFEALGLTPVQWDAAQAGLAARRRARAVFSAAVEAESVGFKARVATHEATLRLSLGLNDTPLLRALELGYEDLDLAELLRVEGAPVADRQAVLQQVLEAKRRAAIAALNPARP